MNKKLIALAVAGALAAPMAAAADSANVTIYGQMHYSWDFVDTNNATDGSDDATGVNRASRVGFKGDEDLGNGLKAIWQVETAVNGTLGNRNTFVGLSGNWGTLLAGRHDTPYKIATGSLDPFSDTLADYNAIIGSTANNGAAPFDQRVAATVAYITPNFNGFTGAIARVGVKNPDTAAGADETEAWSMMGMYQNGPFFASLAYEAHDGALNTAAFLPVPGASATDGSDAWKLGLGYTMGNHKLGFVYENISTDGSAAVPAGAAPAGRQSMDDERDAYYLSYAFAFGNNTLKAAWGHADNSDGLRAASAGAAPTAADRGDDADLWALGIDHAFSKRTSVYALYAEVNNGAANVTTFAGGVGAATGSMYGLNNGANGGYAPAAAGEDVSGFSVGIVHKF